MYLEFLKGVFSTERGVRLTFSFGDAEQSIELSPEAADQTSKTLQVVTREMAADEPLVLTVLGHQVLRKPEAYGLLLRTQEFGDVVFSLPRVILDTLIHDLTHLSSSQPVSRALADADSASSHTVT
jgi:hypothetical protein